MPPIRNRARRGPTSDAVDIAPAHKAGIDPVTVGLPINWSTQEAEEVAAGPDSNLIFLTFVFLVLVYLHYQNYLATDKLITLVEEAARTRN